MNFKRNITYTINSLKKSFNTKSCAVIEFWVSKDEMLEILKKNPSLFKREAGTFLVYYRWENYPNFEIKISYRNTLKSKECDKEVREILEK